MRRALVDMRPDRFEDLIALVALYRPGPMANIPTYCARKARRRGRSSTCTRCSSRSSRRPMASSPTRSRCSRSPRRSPATRWPKPTCCAAPWARRSRPRWTRSAGASSRAPTSTASARALAYDHLRCLRQVRRIRLQQVALGALRLHHLPDGLPQGALPAGVHRRLDDPRHGQHRQAQRIPRRRQEARHRDRAALRQPLGGGVRRRATARSSTPSARSRASGRRSPSTSSRRAATQPFTDLADFADARRSAHHQPADARDAGQCRRLRLPRAPPRAGLRRDRHDRRRRRSGTSDQRRRRHHGHVRVRHARADPPDRRTSTAWASTSGWSASAPPSASTSRRTRSTPMPTCSSGCGCMPWAEFEQAVKEGGLRPGGSPAPSRRAQDRRTRKGTPMASLTPLRSIAAATRSSASPSRSMQFGALLQRRQIGDPQRRGRRAAGRREPAADRRRADRGGRREGRQAASTDLRRRRQMPGADPLAAQAGRRGQRQLHRHPRRTAPASTRSSSPAASGSTPSSPAASSRSTAWWTCG